MPRLIDDAATYIPNDVIDQAGQIEAAQQWGDAQRLDVARQWADGWRKQAGDLLGQVGQGIGGALGQAFSPVADTPYQPEPMAPSPALGNIAKQTYLGTQPSEGDPETMTPDEWKQAARSEVSAGSAMAAGAGESTIALSGTAVGRGMARGIRGLHAGQAGQIGKQGDDAAAKAAAEAEMRASFGRGIERDVQQGNITPELLSPEQAALRAETTARQPWQMTAAEFAQQESAPGLAFPQKLYHGTQAEFEGTPLPSTAQQWGKAVYFATDPRQPRDEFGFGGRVLEYYGDFKKPLHVNTPEYYALVREIQDRWDKLAYGAEAADEAGDWAKAEQMRQEARRFNLEEPEGGAAFSDLARSKGYDAIIDPTQSEYGVEVAVLDPKALKTPGQLHKEAVEAAVAREEPVPQSILDEYGIGRQGGGAGSPPTLASLIPDRGGMQISDLFEAAKRAGLVNAEDEFRALLESEDAAGSISMGMGTTSKGAKGARNVSLSPGGRASIVYRETPPGGPPPVEPPAPPVPPAGQSPLQIVHPHEGDVWHAPRIGLLKDADDDLLRYIDDSLVANPTEAIPNAETLAQATKDLGLADDIARDVLASPDGELAKQVTVLRLAMRRAEMEAKQAQAILAMGGTDAELAVAAGQAAQAGMRNLEIQLAASRKLGTELGRGLQSLKIAVGNVQARNMAESATNAGQMADDVAKAISRSKGEIDPDLLRRWEELKSWYEKNADKLPPGGKLSDSDLEGALKRVQKGTRGGTRGGGQSTGTSAAGSPPNDLTGLGRRYIQLNRAAAEARGPDGAGSDVALAIDKQRDELLGKIDALLTEEVQKALAKEKKLPRTPEEAQAVLQDAMARPIIARRRREIKEQLLGWPKGKFLGGIEQKMKRQLERDLAKGEQQSQKFLAKTSMTIEKEINKTYQSVEAEAAAMEKTAVKGTVRARLKTIDEFLKAGGDPRMARDAIDALRGLGTQARVMAGQFKRDVAQQTATRMVGGDEWKALPQEQRDDLIASLASPVFWEDPRAAGRFAAAMAKPSNWDKAFGMRLASMMSGPPTLVLNALGSLGETAWAPASRAVAGVIERPFPVQRGTRNATERMALDEINGIMNGWRLALQEGAATLRTGISSRPMRETSIHATDIVPRSMPTVAGGISGAATAQATLPEDPTLEQRIVAGAKGAAIGAAGGFAVGSKIPKLGVSPLNGVFRVMAATDDAMRALNKGGAMMAEARREATARGVSLDKIMLNLVDYPQVVARAMRQVERRTYTEELDGVSKLMSQARVHNKMIQTIVPFWNTIANIARMGMERTPVGFAKAQRLAGEGKFAEAATMRAEATMGSGVMLLAGWMAVNDNLTGYGPTDPQDRAMWFAKGYQPYSIRAGDRWISYAGAGAAVVPLGLAASAIDALREGGKEGDVGKGLMAGVRTFGYLFLNVTALRGVSDVVNVITDPDRYLPKWADQLAASYVPATGLLSSMARAFDPEVKDPENVFELMASRVQGMGGNVQPRLGPLGEEVERGSTGPASAVLPVRASQTIESPVIDEYRRLRGLGYDVALNLPREQEIKGFPMTRSELTGYQRLVGRQLDATLADVIADPDYKSADPDTQAMILRIVENKVKDAVLKSHFKNLLSGLPEQEITRRASQRAERRRKAGLTP